MADKNIEKLNKRIYLKMIEGSINIKLFNTIFVKFKDTGQVVDVCERGRKACAFFVSGILTLVGYIDRPHATIKTTIEKLIENNWKEVGINNLRKGDVVIWEKFRIGKEKNKHIGFVLNKDKAVSTSYRKRKVIKHHITFGKNKDKTPKRKIIQVFRVAINKNYW